MKTGTIQTFVRHTAIGISRRGSLGLMGGTAVAGLLAAPAESGARTQKASGKKTQKRCKDQRGQCLDVVNTRCASASNPTLCLSNFTPCCEHFARCDAFAGIACIQD